jgi:hypothetical protein
MDRVAWLLLAGLVAACEFRSRPDDPPPPAPPPATAAPSLPTGEEGAAVHVGTPDGWVQIATARPSPGPEYERLAREAGAAYERGDYELALERARAATAIDATYMSAASTGTLAACKLHRVADANALARGLQGITRDAAGDVCARSGVVLDGWTPMAPPTP